MKADYIIITLYAPVAGRLEESDSIPKVREHFAAWPVSVRLIDVPLDLEPASRYLFDSTYEDNLAYISSVRSKSFCLYGEVSSDVMGFR